MSEFDPETGVRLQSEGTATEAEPTRRTNPYLAALATTWILSVVIAVTLLFGGISVQFPYDDFTATGSGSGLLAGSAVFAALAIVSGIAHLTVRAIGWRPPEG